MSFTTAQIDHLQRNHNSFEAVTLLEMQFRDGTFYASDSVTDRIIGGVTYQGLEGVLSASGVQRKGGFQASSVTYRLHALTGPLIAAIDTDRAQYRDLACVRSIQMYADGATVGDPIVIHRGLMDGAKFRKSGSEDYAEIIVRDLFSSRLNKPEYYSDADQRARFSLDKAFQYVASFANQQSLPGWLFS